MSSVLKVQGPNSKITETHIQSQYEYKNSIVETVNGTYIVRP